MHQNKIFLSAFIIAGLAAAASAESLSPGNYMATLNPAINAVQAASISHQLEQLNDLWSVKVQPSDSTVLFTVKKDHEVDLASVQKAVSAAVPGESMSKATALPTSATQVSPDTDRGSGRATGY